MHWTLGGGALGGGRTRPVVAYRRAERHRSAERAASHEKVETEAEKGNFKVAEELYILCDKEDLAISMYKKELI